MIDLVYLAKGRPEFTDASLASLLQNTDWSKARLLVFTDGDLPNLFLRQSVREFWGTCDMNRYGGPVAIMNEYVRNSHSELWAKIDNDVIVPPGWLDQCLDVMERNPKLDLLGIEPPQSRTRAPWGAQMAAPELSIKTTKPGYAPCDAIGGIGLMRTEAFTRREPMKPHSTYGGFTDWQWKHPEVKTGWIVPPLKVFLLDRLPIEPWISLSRKYIAKGDQRPWTNYNPQDHALWDWWAVKEPKAAA